MNRLQKKCVIVTVGLHLLLLTILFVGPAFFNPEPKADNLTVLDVIPANLVDAAFNSGVKSAAPPPQPVAVPQPPAPAPQPQVAQPVPKPVQPPPEPKPSLAKEIIKYFTPAPKPEPVVTPPEKTEPQPHKIQINTTLVTRPAPSNTRTEHPEDSKSDAKALSSALKNLEKNLSPATKIDMPGNSSVAYANYASVVKSVYDAAWVLPNSVNADENIKVSVTIAREGTVISSRIITPSGDAPADDSVQRALVRVTFVAPFPEEAKDNQRTYTIIFNPQVKSSE